MQKNNRRLPLLAITVASAALMLGAAGCKSSAPPAQDQSQTQPAAIDQSQAPADNANLAPTTDQPAAPAAQPASGGNVGQAAPAATENQGSSNYGDNDVSQEDTNYGQPAEYAQQPPPPLPEYQQPPIPEEGYVWTPGYWSFAPQGYYWVPGAWTRPPEIGVLWTPGYWGFIGGRYMFHHGFWGRHIGYYGGIDYGFGYTGLGYQGGYWNGDHFYYNRAVNNITVTNIHNVYNKTVVINNRTVINNTRVSYNGPGGVTRRPEPAEAAAMREQRIPPMNTQIEHRQEAAKNRQQFASVNHGRPAELVAAKPIAQGKPIASAIQAHAAPPARPEANRPGSPGRPLPEAQPREAARPAAQRPEPHPALQREPARPAAQPHPAPPPHEAARPAGPQHEAAKPAPHAAAHPAERKPEEKPKNKEENPKH